MTKKLKFSIIIAFALMLTLFAGVLAGCGNGNDDNAQIVVKSDMIKTEYVVGEELEITGGVLEYVSNGNTTHVQITKEMISNFSTEKVGSYAMIVTYNGKTTTVGYTVNEGFDLSKIYYSNAISPECWVKFDEQESKMYFIQGYSTAPEDNETWEQYGTVETYVKSFKDGKLNIIVTCVNPNHTTSVAEIKTISETSFDMTVEGETINFKAAKEFDLSKIYYSKTISPVCWVKFDEQESKTYFVQGLPIAPKNDEEWEQHATVSTFTKYYKDGKLFVSLVFNNPDQPTITGEIETISETSFDMTSEGETINFQAAKEFDMTKVYHTDSSYGIWIKINEQESKMYFVQGLTTAPKNNEEWEQYATVLTFTKYYKDGKLFVSLNNPDQPTITGEIETISSSKISLTTDGTTIELTAVN